MIIKVITHQKKGHFRTWLNLTRAEKHIEKFEITTVWFLFIPIYQRRKYLDSNI